MQTVLTADKLWSGTSLLDHPVVSIEDGRIASIGCRADAGQPAGDGAKVLGFPGATLAPGVGTAAASGEIGHAA